MTVFRTNFYGTDGATVTTTTEPLFQSAATTNGTLTYDASDVINGQPTSLKMTPSGSGIRNVRRTSGLSTRTIASQIVFEVPATGGGALLWHGVGATRVVSVNLSSARVLTVIDAAAATIYTSAPLAAGSKLILDLCAVVDSTTATSGSVKLKGVIAGSSSTLFDGGPLAANLGTALLTSFYAISPITSSTVTEFNVYSLGWDDAATDYMPLWFTSSTVGPYGTIAHIGDSTSSQDGNGAVNGPAAYAAAGWAAGDISWYGVGSKTINGADANGKTTVQNIQDARAALTPDPRVFVIALGTNSRGASDATTQADVAAVMTEIGPTIPVLWVGISQATAGGGLDANAIRRNANIKSLEATYPNLRWLDLDAYLRNGRDETGLWFDPPDANYAHMSTTGYQLRNDYIAANARPLAANATVALTGTGTLTASGTPTTIGTAPLTASSTLSTTGNPRPGGTAGLSGTGALTAVAAPSTTGSAALTGAGSLTATGKPAPTGTAALSGSGTLTTASAGGGSGTAALTGTGTLTASGRPSVARTAAFTANGVLTVASSPRPTGTAALAGVGVLSAAGRPAPVADAGLSGAGVLTASAAAPSAQMFTDVRLGQKPVTEIWLNRNKLWQR